MSLTQQAYAKVNLTLEVIFKREDGYHEVATVLQTFGLADTLSFESGETLELRCNIKTLESSDNLVQQAARMLAQTTGCKQGATINLTKNIPVASGLGSGATDAAAALVGLNQLWGTNLSQYEIVKIASKLGSDVAFFLYGGTALAKGHGELISPLPSLPQRWLVVMKPPIEFIPEKTAQVYSQLNVAHFTSGQYTDKLVDCIQKNKHIDNTLLYNVFELVATDVFPELNEYWSQFVQAGAKSVHLAGAGPALFTFVPDENRGKAILTNLEANGLEAYLTRTIEAEPRSFVGDERC